MKKRFVSIILGLVVLSTPLTALASNNVSNMATLKGGKHVAECAKKMDKGVSNCLKDLDCKKGM